MNEQYFLNEKGQFIIKDYQQQKTFASFLPGIAGKFGIPIWAFYVNRGQGIASFGSSNKDNAIMEFYPANKSYQNVSTKGFRTFIKLVDEKEVYEPFRNLNQNISTKMIIAPDSLKIEEENLEIGLKTIVNYYILPNEDYGALVREVAVENTAAEARELEVLDGMPILVPFGIENEALKEVSQTISAWAMVDSFESKTPFYRLRASAEDEAEVKEMTAGNFYLSFEKGTENKLLTPLVDPDVIFAEKTSLETAPGFARKELADFQGEQILENRFPAAMAAAKKTLNPDQKLEIASVFGNLSDQERLSEIKDRVLEPNYLRQKRAESENIHNYYADHIFTVSGQKELDAYSRQTFMDNLLRGGFPLSLGQENKKTYHIFSRKHGDLERDYNNFLLEPTYYSQGNGNFRDVNQNRRCDLYFNPEIERDNLKMFADLIQVDGYNPLVIEGSKFYLDNDLSLKKVMKQVEGEAKAKFYQRLGQEFTPGEIAVFIDNHKLELKTSFTDFIDLIVEEAVSWTEAKFGEGYWIDHWTYNLDLIENYLALYPEKKEELLFEKTDYTFYDSHVKVQPRSQKYLLTENGPRQYNAVISDQAKKKEIAARNKFPYYLRTAAGEIYTTSLFNKLLTLVLNKAASLDPYGMGIEMEANKPGWYDALNGLPGLFGSSIAESMELLRLTRFMSAAIAETSSKTEIKLAVELSDFLDNLDHILTEIKTDQDFLYWQQAGQIKEEYREQVFANLKGVKKTVSLRKINKFLNKIEAKLERAVELAKEQGGLYTMYYSYQAEEYEKLASTSENGLGKVTVKKFKQHKLPPFLEAQVRGMKILKDQNQAQSLAESVKKSELYDSKLGMYRVNGDLSKESYEIGRARAFSPGWLENGSIWLHMEYKYLLELLKNGLYEEYYQAINDALVPFQDPKIYGRSILENSSFILSSLNGDSKNHGRGYIARLSGSTAEYINMWSLMAFGKEPFKFQSGELVYAPEPNLIAELFTSEKRLEKLQLSQKKSVEVEIPADSFAYRFLGSTLVIYRNPKRANTFGQNGVSITEFKLIAQSGEKYQVKGSAVKGKLAQKIRAGEFKEINIFLD
ncbi:FIG00469293: hypothetical protein [Halanaerobium saccharolyticum subsp. saccharolyticum DSM 6643]|uniref:Cellobiose phosphorylase n=1 Tax=Halanaerobium saccharolyticum subsp. saccharolyticum DSM 6643 TaxID=1293054 RepID=M5E370_9FIRM|nr:hypothetical protein [Halanaerobium saccharolyticum]CCU80992.1 FIG00469293: hypothetical protein [Halanaerobium saccharolyticum subsp. saccharolyticum DSM 6643]